MVDNKKIFSLRLVNARKMLAMSQAQLVARMEELERNCSLLYKAVSTTAIEKYEAGQMYPESDMVMLTLATALGVKSDDLHAPFIVEIDLDQFQFRKKSKLGKKAVEAIKLTIQRRIEKYVEVEQIAGQSCPFNGVIRDIVVKDEATAREAAIELRNRWNLGYGPIPQPIPVLEMHGVKVIEFDADPELFDGTSVMVEGAPVLVINSRNENPANPKHQNNEERRRLTLFHELGHKAMTFAPEVNDKQQEDLCNVFANEMLIPSNTFLRIFGSKRNMISSWELKDAQKEFGISVRALMMKAKQLGVVTPNRYKWFCITLAKTENEKFRQDIDTSRTPEQHTSRFERLVYRALMADAITMTKAAQLLGCSVSDLRKSLDFEISNGYNS